ncbi:Hypothetical protein Minf_1372 [Methylacidiphilum infernorum V4]|uniref:Uncharacterized protein n=1 Tax=Methylacidiphilum infernorum (isolate V4) TaxID=481448 RepID=B3DVS3_METI4|nr:Hypothetical protein Minf_1372 [Methylacidiphilum infernorum V4]
MKKNEFSTNFLCAFLDSLSFCCFTFSKDVEQSIFIG